MLPRNDVALAVFIIIGIITILIGFTVFLRNTKSSINQLFFYLTISVAIWIISNHVSSVFLNSLDVLLWSNHVVLISGATTVTLLAWFVYTLVGTKGVIATLKVMTMVSIITALLSSTPLILEGVSVEKSQVVNDFGRLSWLYFVDLFLMAVLVAIILWLAHRKADGAKKYQIDAISFGLTVSMLIIFFGNALLPMLGYYDLVMYAPIAIVVSVVSMAYAIVKHRLFDIRFAVVRALGYILSAGLVFVLYGIFAAFVLEGVLHLDLNTPQEALVLLSIPLAGLLFQPLKKVFDGFTAKLFFRDEYDPQIIYDRLNLLLVSTLDIGKVMKQSSKILKDYMRPEFCSISVVDSTGFRLYGTKVLTHDEDSLRHICQMSYHEPELITITDLIEPTHDQKLKEKLIKQGIAVVVKLVPYPNELGKSTAYILLGVKKSGQPYRQKDIRTLGVVANGLLLSMQNMLHYEEVQKFNVTLQDRIEVATRKLRKTNEKLKALDESKDEFISMASHQLRTPLTSIKGYISMVLDGDAGAINEQQHTFLSQAFTSSQRMASLISDLLNVSRLRTGKFVIEPSAVNLADSVEGEINQLKDTATGRGLTLTYDRPDKFPMLWLDETKTRQVIMNFIDNAIYYTPSGGHIRVGLRETDESVEFTVSDDGIGVPPHEQPHLFTKFYRAGNARKARPDGTGLGLFMAKKVIVAQGGATIFKSTEGKGSTFGFIFPKAKVRVPQLLPDTSVKTPS